MLFQLGSREYPSKAAATNSVREQLQTFVEGCGDAYRIRSPHPLFSLLDDILHLSPYYDYQIGPEGVEYFKITGWYRKNIEVSVTSKLSNTAIPMPWRRLIAEKKMKPVIKVNSKSKEEIKLTKTMRESIDYQIKAFRILNPHVNFCGHCKKSERAKAMHVDHMIPFETIRVNFIEAWTAESTDNVVPRRVGYKSKRYHFFKHHHAFEQAWQAYHLQATKHKLQYTCKHCNLSVLKTAGKRPRLEIQSEITSSFVVSTKRQKV